MQILIDKSHSNSMTLPPIASWPDIAITTWSRWGVTVYDATVYADDYRSIISCTGSLVTLLEVEE